LSKSSNRSRKDRVEQIRREAKAAERRRTLLVVLACGVVAALIVGTAAVSYISRHHNANQ
jgi:cell division septal protein FtsQ